MSFLQKHGLWGAIYPINPKVERIGELTCYPDVGALPSVPDVGIVLLGAERAHQAVRELSQRGATAVERCGKRRDRRINGQRPV